MGACSYEAVLITICPPIDLSNPVLSVTGPRARACRTEQADLGV
jgi:hypothetical protein